jgi:hypothetical protein
VKTLAENKLKTVDDDLNKLNLQEKVLARKENLISTNLSILKKKHKSLL